MRLARIHVVNFRCLRDLTMSFDDVTVLVGTTVWSGPAATA